MRELERLFKGLADQTRLRILNLLTHGELCVCDIQYVLGSPQPNVSRHLTYLRNSGLVLDRRGGPRMFYRLAQGNEILKKSLFAFLREAFSHSEVLQKDSQNLKKAIRHGSCSLSEWRPNSAVVLEKERSSART
jgi:ArsR family transcriptional regulator, arsenate/arsenite/antimonite-responsive transcriptional repressor